MISRKEQAFLVILGIDPGSRLTGFGVIRLDNDQSFYVDSGCLRMRERNLAKRLQQIACGLKDVVQQYQPEEAAIEQIFMYHNPNSALTLGQARGAAMATLTIPIAEYTARQVKLAVVGYGAAKKEQVQHMVARLLNLTQVLQADAADALAVAICHAHSRSSLTQWGIPTTRQKRSRWRDYKEPQTEK